MAIQVFPGKEPAQIGLTTKDLVLNRTSDEFYSEAWYFMGRLLDGTQVFIHYGLTNAGFGDFTGAVEVTVIDPDGVVHFEKSTIKKKNITYKEDVLDIEFDGKHRVKGTPEQFVITSQGDNVSFNLTVKPEVPGLKFGDGTTWFDEQQKEFYSLVILTPKGQMQGTLTTKGESRDVKGYAYGDHSWQNYPAHKMADRLFSMRGFDGNSSASFLVFTTKEFAIPMLVLTEGKNVVLATTQIDVTEAGHRDDEEITKYKVPNKLHIKSREGGPAVEGTIDFTKLLMRQDPVKEFNFIERALIKMFVAKPILYRFDNVFTFTVPQGDGGKTIAGEGVVEGMILRAD